MIGLFVNKSMRTRCQRFNQANFVCIAFDNLTIPSIDIFDVWMKFRNGAATNIASYVVIGIEAFLFNNFNHDFVFQHIRLSLKPTPTVPFFSAFEIFSSACLIVQNRSE